MNDFGSWTQGSRQNEQLKVMDDFVSWAQDPRCYEHLIIVDDINDAGSRDLRPLDSMNNLGLRIIWMILGCEPMALNVMKS